MLFGKEVDDQAIEAGVRYIVLLPLIEGHARSINSCIISYVKMGRREERIQRGVDLFLEHEVAWWVRSCEAEAGN